MTDDELREQKTAIEQAIAKAEATLAKTAKAWGEFGLVFDLGMRKTIVELRTTIGEIDAMLEKLDAELDGGKS